MWGETDITPGGWGIGSGQDQMSGQNARSYFLNQSQEREPAGLPAVGEEGYILGAMCCDIK